MKYVKQYLQELDSSGAFLLSWLKDMTMTVKGFFKGFWEGFKFLFLTPNWGSKLRREQQAYETRLDEAMRKR